MSRLPSRSIDASETIGRLCVAGDRACATGDLVELRFIAHQLQTFVEQPVHRELAALAVACLCDPQHATDRWRHLKISLYRDAIA